MALERILVPVDFSSCSAAALRYAASLRERFDASLEVIHACEIPHVVPEETMILMGDASASLAVHFERQASEQFERFLSTHATDVPHTHELRLGSPAATVREKISEGTCDLVVMGTHGRSGFERFMLGSVAERVVRSSPVPVLTVPAQERAGDDQGSPKHELPKTILVGVDYEKASQQALRTAFELASGVGSRVVAAFVWAAPYAPSAMGIETLGSAPRDLFERVRQEAAQTMQTFVGEQKADVSGNVESECLVVSGDPRSKLAELAEKHHAEMIVVGTHNRTGLSRFLLGSVAEHLLRHAQCPVLAVPVPSK